MDNRIRKIDDRRWMIEVKKIYFLFPIIYFLLINGCAPVLIGSGIVAGYALSSDSASGNVKAEYRKLWDTCMDTLESMSAEILMVNESKGVIRARVSENDITLKIDTLNSKNQRLKISARKYLLPKSQFAQKIFLKILERLS